jgi:hypothetical protein
MRMGSGETFLRHWDFMEGLEDTPFSRMARKRMRKRMKMRKRMRMRKRKRKRATGYTITHPRAGREIALSYYHLYRQQSEEQVVPSNLEKE